MFRINLNKLAPQPFNDLLAVEEPQVPRILSQEQQMMNTVFGAYNTKANGAQHLQQLKESQLLFFGLRDHLWMRGPFVGKRTM
eukprot:757760-Hanusia_phi.AAC.6